MNTQSRPKVVSLNLKSILSLPYRLCNPPPAVPKARTCGITPTFRVQLDDVLERRHLPPLGLKDFEEWLLYCEDSVENLYFILWLKEYTLKHKQWARTTSAIGEYRMDWRPTSSSQLAMFLARAKATFLTPNAPYELNLPSATLEPVHSASTNSSHPDPLIFTEIAIETRKMLDESLSRFVTAQFSNVGNKRAWCGIVAGTIFSLIGALLPLVYNFAVGHSRWLRLTALPGLWLGLTVLLASLNGICIGVYIFGDVRQLRKFELSRPSISKPIPRPRPTISYPINGIVPVPPVAQPRLTVIPPPPVHVHPMRSPSRISSACSDSDSHTTYSEETGAIHISPAYYDTDPIEGPATSPITPDTLVTFSYPTKQAFDENGESASDLFPNTAPFIHPFDQLPEDDEFGGPPPASPEDRQLLSPFDFDVLPRCSRMHVPNSSREGNPAKGEQTSQSRASPRALLERMQHKCVPKWKTPLPVTFPDAEGEHPGEKAPHDSSGLHVDPHHRARRADKSSAAVRKQFKMVQSVPAFAVPLTPVLSDVVVRGQWEIIVRSASLALFIAWFVLGCLLAIPPPRR